MHLLNQLAKSHKKSFSKPIPLNISHFSLKHLLQILYPQVRAHKFIKSGAHWHPSWAKNQSQPSPDTTKGERYGFAQSCPQSFLKVCGLAPYPVHGIGN
jgi:hypothetical protein